MVKLVNTADLKSAAARLRGSIPLPRTKLGEMMEQVLLKLAESAANGGWPAAFAIAVVAICCALVIDAIAFAWAYALTR